MSSEPIHIDVDLLLRNKAQRWYPYIPRPLIHWLERRVHQEEMNEFLANNVGVEGIDFADAALARLDVKSRIIGQERLPAPGQGRYIFASNHPLGGLDGMLLISMLGHLYGSGLRVVVNDMLMQMRPLAKVFLPVNKHGRQSPDDVKAINDAYAGDGQMLYFPAGLCSRRQKGGIIADLDWKKSFIAKSVEYQRPVVPIYFHGQNSNFFYNLAHWRKKMGIKLNIEMIYLPDEMFRSAGRTFTVVVGETIPWQEFTGDLSPRQYAAKVRQIVYQLKDQVI